MSVFQLGEIVDIAIQGVRIHEQHPNGSVTISADAHDGGPAHWPMPPEAVIIRRAPAEWPPVPGDLWRDRNGAAWFAADVHDSAETDEPKIVMVFAHEDYRVTFDQVNQSYGPLKLVHREEKRGGGEQA